MQCLEQRGELNGAEGEPTFYQVIDPTSPLFMYAQDPDGTIVAFLAHKDAVGNPLAISGVLFLANDEYAIR